LSPIHSDQYSYRSRCLAHIINLATQALISKRSQSKFYDAEAPEAHVPDVLAANRDEVGLVRAICVKVICFMFVVLTIAHTIERLVHHHNGKSCLKKFRNARDSTRSSCSLI
jgi:hypothetical protein